MDFSQLTKLRNFLRKGWAVETSATTDTNFIFTLIVQTYLQVPIRGAIDYQYIFSSSFDDWVIPYNHLSVMMANSHYWNVHRLM